MSSPALMVLPLLLAATPAPAPSTAAIPWWIYGGVAVLVAGVGVTLLLLQGRKKVAEETCASCGRIIMADWPRCMFCKAPRGQSAAAALQVVSGPLLGKNIALEAEITSIGSASGSTVLLNDQGVSRKHAGIRRCEDGFEVADLGSKNGVYVNGEKVARKKLRAGDVVRIGTTEMIFKG